MSRVNHKLVKQRLNESRSKITDRQFFTSRILAGHFEDMAAAQTRRYQYNRRVHVGIIWQPESSETASTDNAVIRINAAHSFVLKTKGRENRYNVVSGFFAHELGHVLYTDFLAEQTHRNFLTSYRWYPAPPVYLNMADSTNEADLWEYVKLEDKNLKAVQFVAHLIFNVLEDGYIENKVLLNYPGTLGFGLQTLRQIHYNDIPTVTQLKEKEDSGEIHIFQSILQCILSYVKFGEIKYGDEPLSDERIQIIFGLLPELDRMLVTHSGKERLGIVNLVLIRCWQHIKDFCELCKQKQSSEGSLDAEGDLERIVEEILRSMGGYTEAAEGNGSPVAISSEETEKVATAGSRSKTKEDAENSKSEKENSIEAGTSSTEAESESGKTGDNSCEGSEAPCESFGTASSTEMGNDSKKEVSEEEKGRIAYEQTETVSEPYGGTVEKNLEYEREHYGGAAKDIERVLDKMAEKAACKQLEGERIRELNETAQSISYGNIHEGVNILINRILDVDEELVDQYNSIAPPLLAISRLLQRSLIKQLQDSRRGGKQTGLLMGRRLDAHTLHRNDGKMFYKNNLPQDTPQLAVGLLLDESGSMGSCDRCTYARAAAIILYDFCDSLDIPVMVYGHSTSYGANGNRVNLFSYAEFEGFDDKDRYRMMDIGARGSNRDGAALRFVSEQLSKRPEDVKLLILVSDGQPADSGYYGSAAEEDLRGIKQEYQRKGIIFVAAAIGDDKQNIERIYGESFLDITDLKQLPAKLTSVVKKYVRV